MVEEGSVQNCGDKLWPGCSSRQMESNSCECVSKQRSKQDSSQPFYREKPSLDGHIFVAFALAYIAVSWLAFVESIIRGNTRLQHLSSSHQRT